MFAVKLTAIVPLFVPELPKVMDNHGEPPATAAIQFIVPPPVLATSNVVFPADEDTFLFSGVTDSTGVLVLPSCVSVTFFGLPFAPGAVTVIVPVREAVPVFAIKLAAIVAVWILSWGAFSAGIFLAGPDAFQWFKNLRPYLTTSRLETKRDNKILSE